jgi:hypothetical protein
MEKRQKRQQDVLFNRIVCVKCNARMTKTCKVAFQQFQHKSVASNPLNHKISQQSVQMKYIVKTFTVRLEIIPYAKTAYDILCVARHARLWFYTENDEFTRVNATYAHYIV